MSSVSKVSHDNLSIYNHREYAEEPAEDPKENFKQERFKQKELFI